MGLAASTIALGTSYLIYRGISKTRLDLSRSNASVATDNQGIFGNQTLNWCLKLFSR